MQHNPWIRIAALLTFAATATAEIPFGPSGGVDMSFHPPDWQTAICLPDDPYKSLADKSGALLYHFNEGGREFGTRIAVEVTDDAVWQKQELQSPRVPVVRTSRTANGLTILEEAFSAPPPGRCDWILVSVTNTGNEPRTLNPILIVDSKPAARLADGKMVINENESVSSSLEMIGLEDESRVQLADLTIATGQTERFSICYIPEVSIKPLPASVDQVTAWWAGAALPYGRISVPDAGIQALLDSSVRNIWQAREIKNGLPAFQVGPTCYRGLWIVDGAFLLEAATMLGAGDQARNGIAYELSHQKPDGSIEVLKDFTKENGIVLWTCYRHAQLTQDPAWLESVWPQLQCIATHIKRMRQQTLTNDSRLDDGLVPAGYPDGGIGGLHDEYTNSYWNLLGLRSFAAAARWLGKSAEAATWQAEYDDFFGAFLKASARDMRMDAAGNRFLPILMGEAGAKELPQRAQWAFCHAVYPGQIFAKDDPLVAGNLAMLEATEREGMVYGTGWDATGIWNYFASFYGHAWLWQGNGRKAAESLYAFANHAAPILAWREEQSLKGEPYKKVGDMPHNWASAEFIRLAVHLLALDRGDELHLLEGIPAVWVKPGMVTKLTEIATPFGKLTMTLEIAGDGRTANLRVEPLTGTTCRKGVVHLSGLTGGDSSQVIEFDPKTRNDLSIPITTSLRRTIPLDGAWEIAEGAMDKVPTEFERRVPVPGLADMAQPPFAEPGPKLKDPKEFPLKDPKREAFWYRRTFTLDGPVPPVATLKVAKAMFGTRVILNGTSLGDHAPCFTPGFFDAKPSLRTGGNEVLIRIGADPTAVTAAVPSGSDYEKQRYIPGIFDSVELILSDTPAIVNVRVTPDVSKRQAQVTAWLKNATAGEITVSIIEARTGRTAGVASARLTASPDQEVQLVVPVTDCHLWSPENPFLYQLVARTAGDVFTTRFGMREFRFDPTTGRAMLNGKPYYLRGSNITLYRFFEDPDRGNLPWNGEWVRLLHRRVKDMHWNSLRYCIGFPPEAWYRIADEEGILIQDEYPLWFGGKGWSTWPKPLKSNQLAAEFSEWMRERWNHPSVVIWDASNETFSGETGAAIGQVRGLDPSRRPWDNSYMPPGNPGDVFEVHPYHFINSKFRLSGLATSNPVPQDGNQHNDGGNGVIINEYGWLWLNRDGTPTTLTTELYQNLLGRDATTSRRRHLYARLLAAETEFWRTHRKAAGVLHFTALGYSRPDGQTSDHWLDVRSLTWEPEFLNHVRDAFAPVGLMIDAWEESYQPGVDLEFPVVLINDLDALWKGDVRFRILRDGKALTDQKLPGEISGLGSSKLGFTVRIPTEPGDYQAEATLLATPAGSVRSLRDFAVLQPGK